VVAGFDAGLTSFSSTNYYSHTKQVLKAVVAGYDAENLLQKREEVCTLRLLLLMCSLYLLQKREEVCTLVLYASSY
jgi:hypothetical protein